MKFLLEIVFAVIFLTIINIAIAINGYLRDAIYLESAINVLIALVALHFGSHYAARVMRLWKESKK